MIKPTYYISTGSQGCFYTLRHKWDEVVGHETVTRDYFIRNLAIDREEAIAKAKEYVSGYDADLSATFDVNPIVRREDIDWSVFQAGKHMGESVVDVANSDRQYLVWACENLATSRQYSKTIELAKSYVAAELEFNRKAREEKAAAIAAEEEKARQLAAGSNFVGNVGDRITFKGVILKVGSFKRRSFRGYGEETGYITVVNCDGNFIKCWSHLGNRGEEVSFKGTVKSFDTYDGAKQTTVSRPKVLA